MSREVHVRFCESRGVRFPPATLLVVLVAGTRDDTEAVREQVTAVLATIGLRLSPGQTTNQPLAVVLHRLNWVLRLGQLFPPRGVSQDVRLPGRLQLASGDALAVPQAPAHRLAGAVSSLAARLATHRGEHHAVRPGHGRDPSLPLPGRTDPLPVAGGMTGPAGQPPGMGLGRARCVATRMAGSEVRAGETDRSKGRHRAPARPYW